MTSTTISSLQAIGGAASLIVPALQIMHNKERGKYLKRITPIGWGIIVLAAYVITTALLSINVTNKEKETDKNDIVEKMSDIFSKALEKSGKTYDPKTNTIHDTQSVFVALRHTEPNETFINPILDISPKPNNPVIKRTYYAEKNVLLIMISNIVQNSAAYNIKWLSGWINIKNGALSFVKSETHSDLQPGYILSGNKMLVLSGGNDNVEADNFDSAYVYMKVAYTNKDGISQKPLVRVYIVKHNDIEVQLKLADEIDYTKAINFINKNKHNLR
jgi:hypothetical protein